MAKKKIVKIDFGSQKASVSVPVNSSIIEFKDPAFLKNPEHDILNALHSPIGSAPLTDRIKPGMRVSIGFDDITRPALPAQIILPIVINQLLKGGVKERDILLINACSNHRKNTPTELAHHLGREVYDRFGPLGQVINHDCSDAKGLKYFGVTDNGRIVEINRQFVEADLMIYQGNVSPQPFKTYTGTGVVVGLASTKSIASHHSFHTIPTPDKKKLSNVPGRKKRSVKEEMTDFLNKETGKEVFYVNAITGTKGRLAGIYAGSASEIIEPAWGQAGKIFNKQVGQADVLILGLPDSYNYGSSHNTLIAAVGACVPPRFSPNKPVLREGGIIIAMTPSRGEIDPNRFPSYQEVCDLYAEKKFSIRELVDHEAEFDARKEYIHKYTYGFGYPPLHPFWLMYELESTMRRASSIIMAGVENPGPFRKLGLNPVRDFDEAWKIVENQFGPEPSTVVAPTFFSKPKFKFLVE